MRKITCNRCNDIVIANSNVQKYCKKCSILAKKYKRKEFLKKYQQIDENKKKHNISNKKFRKTEKYKIFIKNYVQIESVKIQLKKNIIKYRQTNKYKIKKKFRALKDRQRRHNIIETYTIDEWNKLLDKTNGICPMCNKFIGKDKLTLDHIYPISLAYKDYLKTNKKRIYTIKDVQPLCRSCNSKKGVNYVKC